MCKCNLLILTEFLCVCVSVHAHANLDEFILDGLCPLQLCLNHLDELGCPVFCPDTAEASFLNELQEKRQKR